MAALASYLPTQGLLWCIDPSDTSTFNGGSISDTDAIDSVTSAAGSYSGVTFNGQLTTERPTYVANVATSGLPGILFTASSGQHLSWAPSDAADFKTYVDGGYTIIYVIRRSTATLAFKTRGLHTLINAGVDTQEYIAAQNSSGDKFRVKIGVGGSPYIDRLPAAESIQAMAVVRGTQSGGLTPFVCHGQKLPTTDSNVSSGTLGAFDTVRIGSASNGTPSEGNSYDGHILLAACYEGQLSYQVVQEILYDIQTEIDGAAAPSAADWTSANCNVTAAGAISLELNAAITGYVKIDDDNAPTIAITSPTPSGGSEARSITVGGLRTLTVGASTTFEFGSSNPVFNSTDEDSAPALTIPASFISTTNGDTNNALASTNITNNSTLNFPQAIGNWAHVPMLVEVLHTASECQTNYIEWTGGHILGLGQVVLKRGGSTIATLTAPTASPYDGEYLYTYADDISGEADGDYIYTYEATPNYGLSTSIRDSDDNTSHAGRLLPTGAASANQVSRCVVKDVAGSIYTTVYVNDATGNDTTGDGSSGTPWKTITKAVTEAFSGGYTPTRIMVADGTYTGALTVADTGYNRPLIIEGTGSAVSDVVYDPTSAGNRVNMSTTLASDFCIVQFRNMRIVESEDADTPVQWFATSGSGTSWVGIDSCERYAASRELNNSTAVPAWQRGCTIYECKDVGTGRNLVVTGAAKDVVINPGDSLVNCYVQDLDRLGGAEHSDFLQTVPGYSNNDDLNIVVQSVQVDSKNTAGTVNGFQAWQMSETAAGTALSSILIRNVALNDLVNVGGGSCGGGPYDHFLIENCTTNQERFRFSVGSGSITLLSIKNSAISVSFDDGGASLVAFCDNNHWRGAFQNGTRRTAGGSAEALFVDAANRDLRALGTGSLFGRVETSADILWPGDAEGVAVATGGAIGALQAAAPTITDVSPATAALNTTGQTITLTTTGAIANATATITAVGKTAHTVNSVTVNSATDVDLDVDFDGEAGTYTITLTNPDGQTATGTVEVISSRTSIRSRTAQRARRR